MPGSSGKTSVLYAPIALRNFVVNPNRPANLFLHIGCLDFGGFNACIFNHEPKRDIKIGVKLGTRAEDGMYALVLSEHTARVALVRGALKLEAEVSVPYSLNMSFPFTHVKGAFEYTISWNEIWSQVTAKELSVAST